MERIVYKIGRIREYIRLINSIKDECLARFPVDPLYRGALLHYLYLLTDSSITLAELVIKQKKLRLPQTYYEAFDILGENGDLEAEFAYSFAKIAGFRNFLAHDYEKIAEIVICEKVLSKIEEVEEFLRQVECSLGI
ncbi:MAG: type VII toxin-antitoxin system HepT family RNase toxin [Desulfobulbaceae bacterium]